MYATAAAEASYLGDQGSRNNLMVFASHLYLQASHQPLVPEIISQAMVTGHTAVKTRQSSAVR